MTPIRNARTDVILSLYAARAAFRLAEQRLGANTELTQLAGFTLARALLYAGEYATAELIARKVWEKMKDILPPDHPDTLMSGMLVALSLAN